jgi:type I restriction enzyme S subunit
LEGYSEYKDINTSWLHSIPKNWVSAKIGELFEERKVKVSDKKYAPLTVGKMGVVPQLSTVAKSNDSDNRKLVKSGDYVINSRSDRKGSSGFSSLDGSVSLINIVLTPREGNGKYYHYLLKSYYWIEEYYRNGRGIVADLWTTRFSEMKSIVLPIPPHHEQDQIVRYLDWKVSMINKYINAKKKQIELLKEYKQAVINEAVTKGGERWKKMPLMTISKQKSIVNCVNRELLSVYLGIGVVPFSSQEEKRTNVTSENLSKYQAVDFGDFVLNNQQAWRGSVGVSKYSGIVSPAYIVLQLDNTLTTEYANYLFQSRNMVNKYVLCSKGVGSIQRNIDWDYLKKIDIEFPPVAEQCSIVRYLNAECEYIDKFVKKLNDEITLLSEYRTCLISDVVTGKVNVQNVKVPEFEAEIYTLNNIPENLEEE